MDLLGPVKRSAALLMAGAVDYEFRTTVCAPLHTPEEMAGIGRWLKGAKRYFLQPFVDSGELVGSGMKPLTKEEIEALRDSVLPDIPSTQIRGISSAIMKAFDATHIPYAPDVIDLLSLQVTADYADKIRDGRIDVETIQDSVEAVLQRAGYAEVAKAYILYRKNREKLRNMSSTILDYKKLVDDYLRVSDWRVKENSTVTYSVGGLILSNSGAITANYWLSEIYDEEIGSAHRNADLHIHDLSMLTGYCAGWSLKQLIQEGLAA